MVPCVHALRPYPPLLSLPMAAIFLAATINVDLPRGAVATAAISGSLLSGATSFQALLGAHWSVP
jgi:hypothetical protein